MFYNHSFAGTAAARRYAAVHSGSRIEGATPHALVKILFDELLIALDATALAERNGDRLKVSDKQARAMSILFALATVLWLHIGQAVFNHAPWGYSLYLALSDLVALSVAGLIAAKLMEGRAAKPSASDSTFH